MTPPVAGIHYGLSFEQYRSIEAISNSELSPIKRSPAHFKANLEAERKDTPALVFGKALHTLVLEPEKFPSEVLLCLSDAKTREHKDYRSTVAENPGKTIVLKHEWEQLFQIAEAVAFNPTASSLLRDTKREVSIVWRCRATGEWCKGRLDAWNEKLNLLIDLKTCTNARAYGFREDIMNYGYERKAAWYQWGMYELDKPVDGFAFIAVEKEKPYGIKNYTLDQHDIRLAQFENEELLKKYSTCKQLDMWPCYEQDIEDLALPDWKRKELEKLYGEKLYEQQSARQNHATTEF